LKESILREAKNTKLKNLFKKLLTNKYIFGKIVFVDALKETKQQKALKQLRTLIIEQ
jgi:hypothetical protein